tara:strand:+ start:189 stop:353 length:165 start_codon:yes stop_codon:yes gene_type:complete
MVLSNSDMLIFNQLVKKKQANRRSYNKRSIALKRAAGNCWWLTEFFNQSIRRNK